MLAQRQLDSLTRSHAVKPITVNAIAIGTTLSVLYFKSPHKSLT